MDARLDPGLAMLERMPGVIIDPAQERPPHASLYAVVGTGEIGRSDVRARSGHGCSVARP
jgi:hypothetical protein